MKDGLGKTDRAISRLIRRCPACGSGDVDFCRISLRPHCNECGYWAPVNFGTADEAVDKWNDKVKDNEWM